MFRGMYPIFWYGIAFMYIFAIGSMVVEMLTDVGTVHISLLGIPLPFLYLMFFMCWILPMAVALMWWYVPMKDKEARAQQRRREE